MFFPFLVIKQLDKNKNPQMRLRDSHGWLYTIPRGILWHNIIRPQPNKKKTYFTKIKPCTTGKKGKQTFGDSTCFPPIVLTNQEEGESSRSPTITHHEKAMRCGLGKQKSLNSSQEMGNIKAKRKS